MSDEAMREDVAKAIVGPDVWSNGRLFTTRAADAAISAAMPHIRRQVIEALIAEAETNPGELTVMVEDASEYTIEAVFAGSDVADWLRSKLEAA